MVPLKESVKLVAAVLAVTTGGITNVASVVLQVVVGIVSDESTVR